MSEHIRGPEDDDDPDMSPDDALTALWVRFKETGDLGARRS